MKRLMVRFKKLDWVFPLAAALGVPLALVSAGSAREIADAVGRIGNGAILALAAATNALTVIP
jgi:hypothetical protein